MAKTAELLKQIRDEIVNVLGVGTNMAAPLVCRIHSDDPQAHPELAIDRMVLEPFVEARSM